MTTDRDPKDDKVRRFEDAVHALIDEGHSLFVYYGLLQKAAERAEVDLRELHPTRH